MSWRRNQAALAAGINAAAGVPTWFLLTLLAAAAVAVIGVMMVAPMFDADDEAIEESPRIQFDARRW